MPHIENTAQRTPLLAASVKRERGRRDKLSWKHVELMRRMWKGRFLVKGILERDDARIARESGLDGVIVSNHGGRNLDGSMAPLEALPQVVEAVGRRVTVMVDSGYRRGTDVVKALALGAKAVMIGRSTLYGVAAAGEAGAARAIGIFREEIDRVLALIGCRGVAELGPEFLHTTDPWFSRFMAEKPQRTEPARAVQLA
jgi:L-lactate dehydrogenase (cytochrome)